MVIYHINLSKISRMNIIHLGRAEGNLILGSMGS